MLECETDSLLVSARMPEVYVAVPPLKCAKTGQDNLRTTPVLTAGELVGDPLKVALPALLKADSMTCLDSTSGLPASSMPVKVLARRDLHNDSISPHNLCYI